jgi:acyl carrier protein
VGREETMIEARVRDFIASRLLWDSAQDLRDDYPLLESNSIDSLGIYELLSFIEREFDVQIDETEILVKNFRDIASIARLVRSKEREGHILDGEA